MTKYLNFFEFESGYTEAVGADQLFYPNVSYTEDDDTVHWNLEQPAKPVQTPMLRMTFNTSTPGEEVKLRQDYVHGITAMEIDGTPVDYASTYSIAEPGSHTAVYQFASPEIPLNAFSSDSIPNAFSAFTSAEITSAVTGISNNAFRFCTALTSVTIPNSVTTIGHESFSNCSGLTSVTIPNSVTTIGVNAFSATRLRDVYIPNSVIAMSSGVFKHCTKMLAAGIGSGVTAIPPETFYGCTSLDYVDLSSNLTAIGEEAFFGCSSLLRIGIPSGVTTIGERAFASCERLYDTNIPSGVTTIGNEAFSRCSGLNAIYLNPETPPTLGANALLDTNNCPIYVPAASVDTYKETWPGYASRIRPMHRITASVNDDSLGQINLNQQTALEGDYVGFNVEVFDSETKGVTSLTITDGNGDEVEYEGGGGNYYSFTMPASDVTINVVIGDDVPEGQYNITVSLNDDSLGNVSVQETASEGDDVEFEVFVYDSDVNQVSSVTVTDGNGDEVEYTDEGDGNYSFTMPASDVTISVVIGEKQREKHTVTVNSTDDLVTGAYPINEETGDWDWDYEGELSFLEGEPAVFAIRLPEGYQAVSAQVNDERGDDIEAELNAVPEVDGVYECFFEMPGCDVNVFVTVEPKQ